MKRVSFLMCCIFGILQADTSIEELFRAIKKAPTGVEEQLKLMEANAILESKKSSLYPKIYGFASYEQYSSPANLAPLLPTETANITQSGGGFPFSKNLQKAGIKAIMPIFNSSLYATIDEAKANTQSIEMKMKLNIISKEALLIELNENLAFLEQLELALIVKKRSILKTKERISVGVKNGRYALAEELKLSSVLSQIEVALNDAIAKKSSIINDIHALTGVTLKKSVRLSLKNELYEDNIEASLLPLQKNLEAKDFALKAAKREFLPTINIEGSVFRGQGDSYDNGENFQKNYGVIGAYLTIPIFDNSIFADNEKAMVAKLQAQNILDKNRMELTARVETLKSNEDAYKKEIKEISSLIESNKKLLEIAKVAYKNGRLSVEEYLRYEDALFDSFAQNALIEASLWKTRATRAALSGIELSKVVE